jgi:hypothetical protein
MTWSSFFVNMESDCNILYRVTGGMKRITKLKIPIPCPLCGGHLMALGYDAPLRILSERGWHFCQECNFQRSIDDFKRELLSV